LIRILNCQSARMNTLAFLVPKEVIMGMRVGSGGANMAMAQMQMAQMAQKPAAPAAPAPVAAPVAAQGNTINSLLSALTGRGGNVDFMV
jgi:hypothetical protein